jgi:hypothetical protein
LELADRAYKKSLYAASARLYSEALDADPKLADNRQRWHRYNAARAAALAAMEETTPTRPSTVKGEEKTATRALKGVGRGETTDSSPTKRMENTKNSSPRVGEDRVGAAEKPLADIDRAQLRNQARTWLEAELATWTKLLGSANGEQRRAIAQALLHWQHDIDLAGVRDAAALARLPEDERKGWKSLWAKVDALLANARKP